MTKRENWLLGTAAALVLVTAIAVIWSMARVKSTESRLAEARSELSLQRQESTLALAAIEATRGSYELGRQLASDFFTGLQADIVGAPAPVRDALAPILAQRDAMITALSRADSQVAPQLIQLLIRYRMALGEPVGPEQQPVSPTPADTIVR